MPEQIGKHGLEVVPELIRTILKQPCKWSGGLLLGFVKPFDTVGTALGAIGNLTIVPLALLTLLLALKER